MTKIKAVTYRIRASGAADQRGVSIVPMGWDSRRHL